MVCEGEGYASYVVRRPKTTKGRPKEEKWQMGLRKTSSTGFNRFSHYFSLRPVLHEYKSMDLDNRVETVATMLQLLSLRKEVLNSNAR
jgi:hypothetical protein